MKKTAKILTVLLSVCVLVGALALAISANTAPAGGITSGGTLGAATDVEFNTDNFPGLLYCVTGEDIDADFIRVNNTTTQGTNDWANVLNLNTFPGTVSEVNENGKGYVKLEYHTGGTRGRAFIEIKAAGETGRKFHEYEYIIKEFDISTGTNDDDWLDSFIQFNNQHRAYISRYNTAGELVGNSGIQYLGGASFAVNPNGQTYSTANGITTYGPVIAPGEWARVTLVYENIFSEPFNADIPAYTDGSTVDETNTVNMSVCKVELWCHVYVNGQLLGSQDLFAQYGYEVDGVKGHIVYNDANYKNLYMDGYRFDKTFYSEGDSILFDNVRHSAYKFSDNADLGIRDAEGNVVTTLVGNDNFMFMPDPNGLEDVTVTWNNGTDTVTNTYKPSFRNSLLVPEYTTTDSSERIDESGWFKWVAGWDQNAIDAIDLTAAGESFTVGVGEQKAAYVDFKLNLTLYTHFQLNFYLPTTTRAAAGVTDVKIATAETGTTTIAKYTDAQIDGQIYEQYRMLFGTADLSIVNFWIQYKIDGVDYSYPVSYGIPYYAVQVMNDASQPDIAKALIMNMVNYADKVLTLANDPKLSLGARVYSALLNDSANTAYLNNYIALADERFALGGDIYESDIATLPVNEGESYFSALGFKFDTAQPVFYFKYSDYAIAQGIDTPSNNQGATSWGHNVSYVVPTFKIGSSVPLPGKHYAFVKNADGSDGAQKYKTDAIWRENSSTDYNYYFGLLDSYKDYGYSTWAHSSKMYDMAELVTVDVYNEGVVAATQYYSLASYINSLITADTQDADAIAAAKALYAYSKAAKAYVTNGSLEHAHISAATPDIAPTCTSLGQTGGTHCEICGLALEAPTTLDKIPHAPIDTPYLAPTCTEQGHEGGTHCSYCNCVITAPTVIPATGHTEVLTPGYSATCTNEGLTAGSHCSACNTVLVEQIALPKLDHTVVIDKGYAATCTSEGLTDGSHCSVCKTTILAQTAIPVTDHTYENGVCINCGDTIPVGGELGTDSQGLKFTLKSDNTAMVSGYEGTGANVIIPETFMGYDVTSINSKVFYNCQTLESVSIPAGVSYIDTAAFWKCSNLSSVTFVENSSLKTIGEAVFAYCGNLNGITLPTELQIISNYAFTDCKNIETIAIPASVTKIGAFAFASMSNLKILTFADDAMLEIIDSSAFASCNVLESVHIPASVTNIETCAFASCHSLKTVTFAKNSMLESIGNYAFDNTILESIIIPKSVITIGEAIFLSVRSDLIIYAEAPSKPSGWSSSWNMYECPVIWNYKYATEGLEYTLNSDGVSYSVSIGEATDLDIVIPATYNGMAVTAIADSGFASSSIESVRFPESITLIGSSAFSDCVNLKSVDNIVGVTVIKDRAFLNCKKLTDIELPSCLEDIQAYAFESCAELTSLIIPEGLKHMGASTVWGCYKLTVYVEAAAITSDWETHWNSSSCPVVCNFKEILGTDMQGVRYALTKDNKAIVCGYDTAETHISIPQSYNGYPVIAICENAFFYHETLESFSMPEGLETIGETAFYQANQIKTLTIPASVVNIEAKAFTGCSNLESISVNSGNSRYISNGNCLIDTETNTLIRGCNTSVIPNDGSVVHIGEDAFFSCLEIESVELPDSLESIGTYAFYSCIMLGDTVIPASVETIGKYAFYGSPRVKFYAEAAEQPSGWASNWKQDSCPVVWGYIAQ